VAPLTLSLSGAVGAQKLSVSMPTALLDDPATVYPVTIDPTTAWTKTQWTYVDSGFPTTSYYNSSSDARIGTYNSGANRDRSLFTYATANLHGKHIIEAHINFNETWSWSCSARSFSIVSAGAFGSGTTWNNQPVTGAVYATLTAAKGYSSACPAGTVTSDFTNWATAAAGNTAATNSIEIKAGSETDDTYWKKFANNPGISVNYNSYPGSPTGRSISPCAGSCPSPRYSNSTTPTLTGATTDPDGGTLRYDFEVWAGNSPSPTTRVTFGSSAFIASGAIASWTVPAGNLVDGSTYEYRVRAFDGTDYGPWSSGFIDWVVDTTAPNPPTVSSSTWTAGSWSAATSGTFTWSDASTDVVSYAWKLDTGNWSTPSTATSQTVSGLVADLEHTFSVRATDRSTNVSATTDFTFGVGTGGLSSPSDQDRTQRTVTLAASGPSGFPYVAYQSRRGSTAAWANVPFADLTTPTGGPGPSSWPAPIGSAWIWNVVSTHGNTDGLIQAQACLYTSTTDPTPTCQAAPVGFQIAVHAFGSSYATSPAGPGTVSLLTGDYSLTSTDASAGSYQGDLSISRSFTTLTPTGETAGATGIFGPGWTAALTGPGAGAGDQTLTDASASGYVTLTDADGAAAVYQLSGTPNVYLGVGDAADGSVLTKNSATQYTLLDTGGTTTVWKHSTTPDRWYVDSIVEPGSASATSYTYNPADLTVARILGAVPNGVDCTTTPDTTPGCRSLKLNYGQAGGHTRLISVDFSAAATAGVSRIVTVASYEYDATGALTGEFDPRISPNLKTTYSYDANARLATITPPGLAPWTLHYDATGRLSSLTRPDAALGQDATTTIAYAVPLSGGGLPDLTATATASWAQSADLPTYGAAVFGPDHVPAATPSAADWAYADLQYLDVNGRTVNTASYGAGAWQVDTTGYDMSGNTTWSLTAGNRAQALTPNSATDPYVAAAASSATRAGLLSTLNTYNSDPTGPFGGDSTVLLDVLGPTHPVVLRDGSTISARAHTHTSYDQGAPVGGPFRLPTTSTSSALGAVDNTDHDPKTTLIGYDKITPADAGEGDGWALRAATKVTTQMGPSPSGADLVKITRYNPTGQAIESRLPAGAAGGDARSTITTYYAASTATAAPGCSGACIDPTFAGLTYATGPAAQPTTGNPLPVTVTTYNQYNQPLTATETAGSTIRTTTATYQGASERPLTSAVAVTPAAAGGTALPAVTTGYDVATGLPTTTSDGTTTLTTGYDTLGRPTSYTDAGGNPATTSYDIAGRPVAVTDGKGAYTYTYDSSTEHRGKLTTLVATQGSTSSTFTATYNPSGALAAQVSPAGVTSTHTYDNTDNPTSLDYSFGGYTFTAQADIEGKTRTQTSPISSQTFSYDYAGRLAQTNDTLHTGGTAACTVRQYTLDMNSNRTALVSYPDDGTNPATGNCTTATTPTTVTSAFDQADRITNTGHAYDTLGRTTTLPAVDAQGIGSHATTTGDVTVGYYANDLVASQTQGTQTVNLTLDPQQNRFTTTADTTTGLTTTSHYAGGSDSPAWSSTSATNWTWNIIGIDGALAGTKDQGGTLTWNLTNLHGDVTGATDNTGLPTAASYESTEYGAPRNPATTPDTYGWLGAKQRSTNDLGGLTLMGVRLYNPQSGRFLSVDPIPGGNDNAYTYPTDPINGYDLNGKWGWSCGWCEQLMRARNYLQAEEIGLWAAAYTTATGGRCRYLYGLRTCQGGWGHLYSRGGTTWGSTYVAAPGSQNVTPLRIRHETIHRSQWRWFGRSFIWLYLAAGSNPCTNVFERQAGLIAGGYKC
jgi:RHS repeat-associated protein